MSRSLVLALGLALSAACDPTITAQGMVRDSSGAAVVRATVTLTVDEDPRTASVVTDSSGHFEVTRFGDAVGRVRLRACHPEFGMAQAGWERVEEIPDSVVLVLAGASFLGVFRKCL